MATLKDIARISGFSLTTVSRALNGYSDVNEDTRSQIEDVAKKLKYSPNLHAKSLVENKSNRIGFVIFEFGRASGEDSFVYELILGMQMVSLQNGYELVFLFDNEIFSDDQEGMIDDLFMKYSLDGLIIMGYNVGSRVHKELKTTDRPVVCIDGGFVTDTVGCVTVDGCKAIQDVVTYLTVERGRRHVMFLNGKRKSYACRQRLKGYKSALKDQYSEKDVYYAEYSEAKAISTVEGVFEKGQFDYDGVVCSNDMMAVGVLKVLKKHHLIVGKDVDVVGFDNITISRYLGTPLTTVDQNMRSIGEHCVGLLLNIMNHKSNARTNKLLLPYRIILRETTGGNSESDE